jgi:hypothetical protein
MDSTQTLHDFVLNLLSDPQARTAFELDPEGTLHDAGLSDITAMDVQDVIPLVIDYAPVQGLTALEPDQLGLGALDALPVSPTAAIQQLQLVTQQLPSLGLPSVADSNLAAAGALTTGGLTSWASASLSDGQVSVSAGGELADSDGTYSATHDVSLTLDSSGVTDTVDSLPQTATGLVDTTTGTVDSVDLTGTLDGVTGDLTGGLTGDVHGLTGDLTDGLGLDLSQPTDTHDVTAPVESTVSQVTSAVHSTSVIDTAHGLLGDTTDHLPTGDTTDGDTHLLF